MAVLLAISCSPDDSNTVNFRLEFVPVESVDLPEHMTPGETYQIKVNFRLPTDCHYFDGFYYHSESTTRTVGVQAIVIENANCESTIDAGTEQKSFNFLCLPSYAHSTYLFRFYQGETNTGEAQYLEVLVPVQ
ncbi:hypothetical protein CHU92_08825 [Flavobacterium cyanobacteriorum]|uniref:Uncharacterized protein n=2 Tax=Flavobacterium cyanobacteriorum TaxID=2022802 RepID=A0A255Z6F6_9FLAO|nr:hypothetical protein CHU92_08825 [Flavobacterium cyanobacteriorum]